MEANVLEVLKEAKQASYNMACLSAKTKNDILKRFAQLLREEKAFLLTENQKDIEAASKDSELLPALKQRLKLDENKIEDLAKGIEDIAQFDEPVGRLLAKTQLDDGLVLEK